MSNLSAQSFVKFKDLYQSKIIITVTIFIITDSFIRLLLRNNVTI